MCAYCNFRTPPASSEAICNVAQGFRVKRTVKKINRLALIAHHEIVRCGLSSLINRYPNCHIAFECGDSDEFERFASEHSLDLLILDMSLGRIPGLDALQRIRQTFPNLPILMLAETALPSLYKEVLSAGANGYLLKHEAPSELKRAIEAVAEGKQYVCPLMAERLACNDKVDWKTGQLSPRQTEVAKCLALGMTVAETAARLGMKPKTVSSHRTEIFSKLGLRTTADLVLFALRTELISLDGG